MLYTTARRMFKSPRNLQRIGGSVKRPNPLPHPLPLLSNNRRVYSLERAQSPAGMVVVHGPQLDSVEHHHREGHELEESVRGHHPATLHGRLHTPAPGPREAAAAAAVLLRVLQEGRPRVLAAEFEIDIRPPAHDQGPA